VIAQRFKDFVIEKVGLEMASTEDPTPVVDQFLNLLLAPRVAINDPQRLDAVGQGGEGFAQMHLVADDVIRIPDREVAHVGILGGEV
jgi:hypothetical protein